MGRRVFFSFHYERDIWRANQVRNSWVMKDREDAGFWDASLWEEAKRKGDTALKKMINEALEYTSVTTILSAAETFSRKWVRYEIAKSFIRKNGIINVNIHKMKDQLQKTDLKGPNPLLHLAYWINTDAEEVSLLEWSGTEWQTYNEVPSVPVSKLYHRFDKTIAQLSSIFPNYDWVDHDGYNRFASWVERAASAAGR